MYRREARITDVAIADSERRIFGARPEVGQVTDRTAVVAGRWTL